ncbi:MAG TPA: class I SAM-dependent RNA methyltransferase [Thermodesulfobacteriota bacterium]|nr:class I SAM-dependent RNA methyltransferase [Thermodesulfobacteriota bacterium]
MAIVKISELSWGGQGISRIEGKVVFVSQALPGETVEIEIIQSKKDYSLGKLLHILDPSPDRIAPPCPVYQECGGCQLQHLGYQNQVIEKERLFKKALVHALPGEDIQVYPSLPSPKPYGYRHRLFLKSGWSAKKTIVGFYKPKSHQVVNVEGCLLANKAINHLLNPIKEQIRLTNNPQWTPEIELQIFENPHRGGVIFSSPVRINRGEKKMITANLGSLGLDYVLFKTKDQLLCWDDTPFAPGEEAPEFLLPAAISGLPRDIRLTVFPDVFTQVNLEANLLLISRLFELDLFHDEDRILDAYCGLGNFSLPLCLKAKEVLGLESLPGAVANARWNQSKNKILNCFFIQAKVDAALKQPKFPPNPVSLAVLDPPRTGVKDIIPLLDLKGLKGLLYISCNPSTLFRDLILLKDRGWRVEWSQPVDFFPQTYHLESVTFLKRLK